MFSQILFSHLFSTLVKITEFYCPFCNFVNHWWHISVTSNWCQVNGYKKWILFMGRCGWSLNLFLDYGIENLTTKIRIIIASEWHLLIDESCRRVSCLRTLKAFFGGRGWSEWSSCLCSCQYIADFLYKYHCILFFIVWGLL